MSLIGNITWINQNTQISSIVIAENVARDVVSKEVQKVLEEEKELKVKKVTPVEESEKTLTEDDKKHHLNLKA
jgi:isoaspartyl peptidase/L-asparaginase-like protein (Ntn-hydrolase superfamily)